VDDWRIAFEPTLPRDIAQLGGEAVAEFRRLVRALAQDPLDPRLGVSLSDRDTGTYTVPFAGHLLAFHVWEDERVILLRWVV
jgi:hypothetical protein